jgi:3-methylcrotonyl-CoA carboxylase alpha subunit
LARVTKVTRIGDGVYRVEVDGRSEIVYVAGARGDRWVFWNGHVFRGSFGDEPLSPAPKIRRDAHQALSAPMPATVITVLVEAGASVKKGETLIILEAMKMELPLRASSDATVKAVHCREGDLVQPDTVLVELS